MNVTRIAILGVALVAGGVAFFLMMSGNAPETPIQIVEQANEKTVRVLVADRDYARGDRFTVDGARWAEWPEKSVSPMLMTDAAGQGAESLEGAVARTLILAGEPIVESKIVRAGDAGLMSALLTPGARAVTQRVSPETAVGGFILPGDHVDVLYTETSRSGGSARTRTIFENVRVLAVNELFQETPEATNLDGVNVTLEFSPQDAEAFISARSAGSVSLALRSVFKPEGEVESQSRRSSDVTVIRYGRS